MAGLVEEIEAEARAERESRGLEPLGVEAILKQTSWRAAENHAKASPRTVDPRFFLPERELPPGSRSLLRRSLLESSGISSRRILWNLIPQTFVALRADSWQ